jgi:hypothetical protein
MVADAGNSSYLGGRGRRIMAWGQPGQKLETLPKKQTKKQKDWLKLYRVCSCSRPWVQCLAWHCQKKKNLPRMNLPWDEESKGRARRLLTSQGLCKGLLTLRKSSHIQTDVSEHPSGCCYCSKGPQASQRSQRSWTPQLAFAATSSLKSPRPEDQASQTSHRQWLEISSTKLDV